MTNVLPDFEKLAAIKEHFEGYRTVAYKDSGGVWTVGYGSTFNHDKGRKVMEGDTAGRPVALRWMAIDVSNAVKDANRYIKVKLNPDQSAALIDYIYNRGIPNFLKTNLDELININPNDSKIANEFLEKGLWDRLGNKLWGLGRRRRSEAWLYFKGQVKTDWPRWGEFKL